MVPKSLTTVYGRSARSQVGIDSTAGDMEPWGKVRQAGLVGVVEVERGRYAFRNLGLTNPARRVR